MKAEVQRLEDSGVIHAIRNRNDLQEAPSAYKDIDTVINNQLDLIEVKTRLMPVAVIKWLVLNKRYKINTYLLGQN